MELQIFSQLIVDSWYILILISFCNLLVVDLVFRVLFVIVQPPRMALLIGNLGSLQLYTLGMDVSTAFMSLSHKVTASSSSSSCVVMFVSMLVRLSLSVCCVVSHHLFCQIGNVVR